MQGLLRVLSDEIVLHSDGGGRVSAARHPIVGPDKVARLLLGLQRKYLSLTVVTSRTMLINGQPGLIWYLQEEARLQEWLSAIEEQQNTGAQVGGMRPMTKKQLELYQHSLQKGEPVLTMALTLAEHQIQEIDMVANPEKLRHIPRLSFEEEI
jgi:RNA polymerase sigma-70 factor (ECF subfamily)